MVYNITNNNNISINSVGPEIGGRSIFSWSSKVYYNIGLIQQLLLIVIDVVASSGPCKTLSDSIVRYDRKGTEIIQWHTNFTTEHETYLYLMFNSGIFNFIVITIHDNSNNYYN